MYNFLSVGLHIYSFLFILYFHCHLRFSGKVKTKSVLFDRPYPCTGPTLTLYWSDPNLVLVRPYPCTGPTLSLYWSDPILVLVRPYPCNGPTLSLYCSGINLAPWLAFQYLIKSMTFKEVFALSSWHGFENEMKWKKEIINCTLY